MPEFKEADRFLYVTSPLGEDVLLLDSFTGAEGMSQLFSFQLELYSEKNNVKFEDILGKKISFGVKGHPDATKRHFHGTVTSFSQLPTNRRLSRYRAEVSPDVWVLTKKYNTRIFQNKNASDILKVVLTGLDVEYKLQASYRSRDYCTQFRETDFNFISRLMEEEGIGYYFKFAEGSHKLVIFDSAQSYSSIPGPETLIYDEVEGGTRDDERITGWEKTQHWTSGKVTLWDHCFQTPSTQVNADQQLISSVSVGGVAHKLLSNGNDKFEVYDYPSRVVTGGEAPSVNSTITHTSKMNIQELEVENFTIRGTSKVWCMTPGHKFRLDRHFNGNGFYVLTQVVHAGNEGDLYAESPEGKPGSYSNNFECLPSSMNFRPSQASEKPTVRGCQTALVVGQAGEEIYTDKFGRIKVQFFWDRQGKKDQDSSCWVRVATMWAGSSWGSISIPRMGMEVVVDFLDGDPDRPLVIGCVYNAENMPPYGLPGDKTKSCVKSNSSLGGGGSNEFRFEDKKGSEEIYVHAQKDMNTVVEHDETRKVLNDRTTTITHDDTRTVNHDSKTTTANNDTETVGNKQSITIGSDQDLTVGGKQTITIASSKTETVGSSVTTNIASSETRNIASSRTTSIAASDTLTAGASINITAGGGVHITSGAPVTITAPTVQIAAAMVQCAGVVQCITLITTSVVSPAYTPGAGNMM